MVVGSPTGFVWMEVILRNASEKTFSRTQRAKRRTMSPIMLIRSMSHRSRSQRISYVKDVPSLGSGMETQPWRTTFSSIALIFRLQALVPLGADVPFLHAVAARPLRRRRTTTRRRRSSNRGGCCKWGGSCGDCGNDGTGWCHKSASNCQACTGSFDINGQAPACRSVAFHNTTHMHPRILAHTERKKSFLK